MTEYYYLDQNQETHGPHTLEELKAFYRAGTLGPATLVSSRGSSHWYSLASLLAKLQPVSGVVEGAPGQCPTCHRKLELDGPELPCVCACGRPLRPEKEGLWANFKLAMSQYARFSGRATRAEYWGFWLFATLINMFFYMLMEISTIMTLATVQESAEQMENTLDNAQLSLEELLGMMSNPSWLTILAFIAMLLYVLSSLVFLLPSFAAMTRRLHDVGWSGWWIVGMYAPMLTILGGILWCFSSLSGMEPAAEHGLGSLAGGVWVILLSYLVMMGLGILILVLTLLDSQRGPNKYGPSRKYPMG